MISKFPLFTSNLLNTKDYRFDVFAYLESVYRPHQATQSVSRIKYTQAGNGLRLFFTQNLENPT